MICGACGNFVGLAVKTIEIMKKAAAEARKLPRLQRAFHVLNRPQKIMCPRLRQTFLSLNRPLMKKAATEAKKSWRLRRAFLFWIDSRN